MDIQEEDVEQLRVALGRQLATWRDAAQETQRSPTVAEFLNDADSWLAQEWGSSVID